MKVRLTYNLPAMKILQWIRVINLPVPHRAIKRSPTHPTSPTPPHPPHPTKTDLGHFVQFGKRIGDTFNMYLLAHLSTWNNTLTFKLGTAIQTYDYAIIRFGAVGSQSYSSGPLRGTQPLFDFCYFCPRQRYSGQYRSVIRLYMASGGHCRISTAYPIKQAFSVSLIGPEGYSQNLTILKLKKILLGVNCAHTCWEGLYLWFLHRVGSRFYTTNFINLK